MKQYIFYRIRTILIFIVILFSPQGGISAQPGYSGPWYREPWFGTGTPAFISFGIHFDPLISWFATKNYDIRSQGAIPGYNFGISYNRYFSPNYSFSSGINIIESGGRLISNEVTYFEVKNYRRETVTVEPGEVIIYKIKYFSVPLGIKLQTNENGYRRLFADLGFDPKIVISGRTDIPSLNIMDNNAMPELKAFNLSFHFMAGFEYSLGGTTSAVFGMGFDNNFLDVTRDNNNEPWDMVYHKLLSFRLGINF